jgi:hypothetical protein
MTAYSKSYGLELDLAQLQLGRLPGFPDRAAEIKPFDGDRGHDDASNEGGTASSTALSTPASIAPQPLHVRLRFRRCIDLPNLHRISMSSAFSVLFVLLTTIGILFAPIESLEVVSSPAISSGLIALLVMMLVIHASRLDLFLVKRLLHSFTFFFIVILVAARAVLVMLADFDAREQSAAIVVRHSSFIASALVTLFRDAAPDATVWFHAAILAVLIFQSGGFLVASIFGFPFPFLRQSSNGMLFEFIFSV